jgi:hypothetical protein
MLDLDDTKAKDIKSLARKTCKRFRLGGFIMLKSSLNNYHVVFNKKVSWKDNMAIVAWMALESKKPKLQTWFIMQCIKQGSTLRISKKRDKPCPRIVYREGREDNMIKAFLEYRIMVKYIMGNLT